MDNKPEFWIDEEGFVYQVSDRSRKPVMWIKDNYIYRLPNTENKTEPSKKE